MTHDVPEIELRIVDERLRQWGLPRYETELAAGLDVRACLDGPLVLQPQASPVLIPTGFAVLMNNPNMAAFLLARSGLGHKKGLVLSQAVGTIDADYSDQIFVSAWLRTAVGGEPLTVMPGDRIAQLVFLPIIRPRFNLVDNFSSTTKRGTGGFGSTGVSS